MFISDDECSEHLNDPRNILNQIAPRDSSEPLEGIELPVMPDADVVVDEILHDAQSFDPEAFRKSKDFDPFIALKLGQLMRDKGSNGRHRNIRNKTTQEVASIAVTSLLLGAGETYETTGSAASMQHFNRRGLKSPGDIKEGRPPREDLLEAIYNQSGQVINKAFLRLNIALDLLTEDKLKEVKATKDLVHVALGMGKIVSSLTPKESKSEQSGAHFHIYRPEQGNINDYETVRVGRSQTDEAAEYAAVGAEK